MVAIIVRTPDTLDNIDNCCFQIMISTHKNIFSQISSHVHETCRWLLWARQISDEVSHLIVIFGISTFCSNYSSTSLWHSAIIFPENFNTNVILCQSIQRISFECTIYLSSLFSNSFNICLMGLMSGLWGGQFVIFNVPADFLPLFNQERTSLRLNISFPGVSWPR